MPRKWWQFWRRTRPQWAARVVVYTRAQCPLCDKAAKFLESERQRRGFELSYIDIAADAALTEKYREWIPVVEVDGQVRFRGSINPVLWKRLMER